MIELFSQEEQNLKKSAIILPAACCTRKHLALYHSCCQSTHNTDIHIHNHIINHIRSRHGPLLDHTIQYNVQIGWNSPTVFLPGSDFAIYETLINPDVMIDQHRRRYVVYCKEFDFPIGLDNQGNDLFTCKCVVHVGRRRNNLITAFPLKKNLQEKQQYDCTILCEKIKMEK